jgi:hypothetical protein
MANTYKNFAGMPTDTNKTTIYTTPGATVALVKSLYICNNDVTTQYTTNVYWYDSSDSNTEHALIVGAAIPAQSTLQLFSEPFVLEAGDYIAVQSSTGSKLEYSGRYYRWLKTDLSSPSFAVSFTAANSIDSETSMLSKPSEQMIDLKSLAREHLSVRAMAVSRGNEMSTSFESTCLTLGAGIGRNCSVLVAKDLSSNASSTRLPQ